MHCPRRPSCRWGIWSVRLCSFCSSWERLPGRSVPCQHYSSHSCIPSIRSSSPNEKGDREYGTSESTVTQQRDSGSYWKHPTDDVAPVWTIQIQLPGIILFFSFLLSMYLKMKPFIFLYRDKMPQTAHHANGRAQASSHLHLVVFHDVDQHLPPVVAVGDGNGGDRRKPQILHDMLHHLNFFLNPWGQNRATPTGKAHIYRGIHTHICNFYFYVLLQCYRISILFGTMHLLFFETSGF